MAEITAADRLSNSRTSRNCKSLNGENPGHAVPSAIQTVRRSVPRWSGALYEISLETFTQDKKKNTKETRKGKEEAGKRESLHIKHLTTEDDLEQSLESRRERHCPVFRHSGRLAVFVRSGCLRVVSAVDSAWAPEPLQLGSSSAASTPVAQRAAQSARFYAISISRWWQRNDRFRVQTRVRVPHMVDRQEEQSPACSGESPRRQDFHF